MSMSRTVAEVLREHVTEPKRAAIAGASRASNTAQAPLARTELRRQAWEGGPAATRNYFFRFTTRIRLVVETAPGVSASSMIAACSSWCRLPEPVAGLALSGRPT
jgi:hypothetical protein